MTTLRSAALLAAFALALGPAHAQDASGTAAEAAEDETVDANEVMDLSLGEDVTADGVGSTYIAEEFTDWSLRCIRTPEGQDDVCELYQLLRDAEGNAVAEISLTGLPEGAQAAAGATIITPLETLLTERITIAVDGGQTKAYPFSFCSAIGCFARIGFTAEEVGQFRRGAAANISIVPAAAPDQRVDLTMSLSGFTAGFEAVDPR